MSRVYTDHAVFELADGEVTVRETYGIGLDELRSRLDVEVHEARA